MDEIKNMIEQDPDSELFQLIAAFNNVRDDEPVQIPECFQDFFGLYRLAAERLSEPDFEEFCKRIPETGVFLIKTVNALLDKEPFITEIAALYTAMKLEPYITEELTNPKYNGQTLEYIAINNRNLYLEAVKAAEQAKERSEIRSITLKDYNYIKIQLDKVTADLTNLKPEDIKKPIHYVINNKTGEELIFKIISGYAPIKNTDLRLLNICPNLYETGNTEVSLTHIYGAMGHTGKPGTKQLEDLAKDLAKLNSFTISIKYKEGNGGREPGKVIEVIGSVLPNTIINERVSVNGAITNSVVKLEKPILRIFAESYKQMTAIKKELLKTPLALTNKNAAIENYLFARISRMKPGGNPKFRKIKYDRLFEKAKDNSRAAKSRTKVSTKEVLNYFVETGYIKGFKELSDGVLITPNNK